ncbi:hypothetical protein DDE18_21125 [Nocardioides gansuensis]|uniref:Polymer-forming cytoskeletal protein n=1 Tax=Nocardioides gansuensis TaxID=2138300 RepID=A0A2T8F594_9ACTN|nr:hypothetical protein DDE18_21125 [Nocardioides gansuensis]
MNRILACLVALPLVAVSLGLGAAPAHADDTTCHGTIGAVSLDGNVIVPEGALCRLIGTRVDGNVQVKSGAVLKAKGVRVGGSVQAENHERVVVKALNGGRSHVDGSIQLKQGDGGRIARTDVGSDIQLFTNVGLFVVESNHVDGNLQCKSNNPKPTGSNNVVQGNKEDQCRDL